MAHVRKGKAAKLDRRLGALERLELERDDILAVSEGNRSKWSKMRLERIKSEIAALELRI